MAANPAGALDWDVRTLTAISSSLCPFPSMLFCVPQFCSHAIASVALDGTIVTMLLASE